MMQFDWPTPEQINYRINRLRRLVVLAVTIPVVALLFVSAMNSEALAHECATIASLSVALLITGHVVLFPNAPFETLSLSISLAIMAIVAPWMKAVSLMAPPEHADAALVIMIALTFPAIAGLMIVLQFLLGVLMMSGPAVKLRLRTSLELACSPTVARNQFTLRPDTRRGRILTGPVDDNGFFEVGILAPQVADPENPSQPMIVRIAAKVVEQSDSGQQTMLVLPSGAVTVTSEQFTAVPGGCQIEITEQPGDFTLGMHAMFWLTDQQMDNLTETADLIEGEAPRVNGLAHGVSMLSIVGAILSPHQPVVDRAD